MGFRNRSHAPPKMNIYAVLGGRGLLVAGRRDDTVGCWRTGRGGHRPTYVRNVYLCKNANDFVYLCISANLH